MSSTVKKIQRILHTDRRRKLWKKTFKIGNSFDKADDCTVIKHIAQADRDHPNINQFKNKKI